MQYRLDKRTGNKLSVLGFGCMRLPRNLNGFDMKKSEQIIMKAIDNGVNYFDTAYLYAGSEEVLGSVLAKNRARDKVYIATKFPIAHCHCSADFDRYFSQQLTSLQTDYIDYYLMHNINTFVQWEQLCALGIEDWIRRLKEDGKIHRIGFSFHGTKAEYLKLLDAYDWDFCQIQYNYSDENYQAGAEGLRKAAAKEIPVIIMEPLLGGKLATGLPKEAEVIFKKANGDLSPAAWGLRWLLDQPEVTVILSGMNSDVQVEENLRTVETFSAGMLTEAEKNVYREVVQIFKESYKVPCTGCGYCMPCPQNVNIPGSFASYNTSFALGRMAGLFQYVTGTGANRKTNQIAGNCIGCGKCEKHCPQNIEISKALKDVKKRMEPFYFKMAMSVMRRSQRM